MTNRHTFTAVIQNAGGGGAFVEIPFDVEAAFGSKKPKVKALIEGVPYRGTLTRTPALAPGRLAPTGSRPERGASVGGPNHMLIVLKGIRAQIGKTFGDEVEVTVEPDAGPRTVEIPPELAKAFRKENAAGAYFNSLAFSHKREYVNYILEAKKEETRLRRVAQTIELLKKGKKER